MDKIDTLRIARQIIRTLHLRKINGEYMKPWELSQAIRSALPKKKEGGKLIPNKFEKQACIGYAIKYNGVVIPQTFVLGTDSHQRVVAKQLFCQWAFNHNLKEITFEMAESDGEAIVIKLKEVKS